MFPSSDPRPASDAAVDLGDRRHQDQRAGWGHDLHSLRACGPATIRAASTGSRRRAPATSSSWSAKPSAAGASPWCSTTRSTRPTARRRRAARAAHQRGRRRRARLPARRLRGRAGDAHRALEFGTGPRQRRRILETLALLPAVAPTDAVLAGRRPARGPVRRASRGRRDHRRPPRSWARPSHRSPALRAKLAPPAQAPGAGATRLRAREEAPARRARPVGRASRCRSTSRGPPAS